ncbi:astacin [Teladorsagia circumcincta]|uniref:Astacin n=1 Tax=Teladorsagia circumcincta TaxID=45464 RepID=A0A2G9U253_TELCI|nr:astacin [Teladorsagia circumcincta]
MIAISTSQLTRTTSTYDLVIFSEALCYCERIQKKALEAGDFKKESEETNYNYNLTYDYGSVMHYAATSASINKRPTLVPNDIMYKETLGSDIIAFYDLLMMNMFYDCTGRLILGFCSKANSNTVLTSNSSLVPVITYKRQNRTTVTKLEYRYV